MGINSISKSHKTFVKADIVRQYEHRYHLLMTRVAETSDWRTHNIITCTFDPILSESYMVKYWFYFPRKFI